MWNDSNRQPRPGIVNWLMEAIASFRSRAAISFILSVISRSYFIISARSSLNSVFRSDRVPPNIRERLNSEWLLQIGHLSFELVLTTSQSIHNTALCMGIKLRSGPAPTCIVGPLFVVDTTEDGACLRVAYGCRENMDGDLCAIAAPHCH